MAIPMERTAGGSTEFVESISELLPQPTLCAASPGVGLEEPRPGCSGGDLDAEDEIRMRKWEERKLMWAVMFEMWRQEQQIQDEKDEQELEMKILLRQQEQEEEWLRSEKEMERTAGGSTELVESISELLPQPTLCAASPRVGLEEPLPGCSGGDLDAEEEMANHEMVVELRSQTQALLAEPLPGCSGGDLDAEEEMANHEMVVELRSQTQALLASTEQVAEPVIAKSLKSKCTWWKKHQAPTAAANQDPNSCASTMKVDESQLDKIRKLEKKVREAEKTKQLRALAKAQKKAAKEEKKKNKTDNKKSKAEKVKVTGFWARLLCFK
ncbi:uncharacterized protein LOC134467250 [Engraulis encrasicolus]|uniref:uncharacterized protein LOC134467250 n=1 Tax=Engraulis encrasicolus TaxID=184585 RepID=UPI002FD007FD